jgi:hypothetical protein
VAPIVASFFAVIFESIPAAAAVAGGAVAIPIIIHLLNRKRFRVVTWAAMRFLLAAQRKNSRRMRLEQIVLLAVRCLMVLLLVLAMASVTPWAEAVWHWWDPEGGLGPASAGLRTHKVLVLDGSFSMGLKDGAGTCFDKARNLAAQLVRESSGGDGFSVVLMAAPPRRIVPEPSEDSRKVAAEIDALRLTHGNADLFATLSTVESLVQASPGKYPDREVYFFTDLQQSTWISRQPSALAATLQKIQARARTIFVDVGHEASNIAVTDLSLGESMAMAGRETPILATLHNYGETRSDVSVRLYVGRARTVAADKGSDLHEVGEQLLRKVERNQPIPVAFKYKFPAPGDYVLQVQVQHDDLELDDLRSVVVAVKNTIPVMLVNGKPATEVYDRATEFLRTALNPRDEVGVAAQPKVLSESQFADEGLGDLTGFDCVFLCDVPRFSLAEVRRLENHVRRGGSVIFCMGDRVDLGSYNEMLYRDGKGLLPARLVGKQQATPGWHYQLALDPDADREDPLKPFRSAAAREILLLPRFRAFVQTEPAPRAGPRRVLGFVPVAIPGRGSAAAKTAPPPGGAAILEWHPPVGQVSNLPEGRQVSNLPEGRQVSNLPEGRQVSNLPEGRQVSNLPEGRQVSNLPEGRQVENLPHGGGRLRGRVVLITTTVHSDWNNWSVFPSYIVLMQELLRFAASARLREQAVEVGEPLELFLPGTVGGLEATVRTPDGRTESARTQNQDAGAVRWTDTDVSGVYSITVGSDPREHLFAVNVPALNEAQQQSESDLTRTTREELQKTYPEWELQVVTDPGQATHTPLSSSGQPEMAVRPLGPLVARWLLLALLVLVILEVVLAWKFGHYSAVAEPEQPGLRAARPRHAWVLLVLPGVLFALGLTLAGFLVHDAWTGDFLGFLPEGMRRWVEHVLDIPPPAPGEGSRWRTEYTSFLWDNHADRWLAGLIAVAAAVGVWLIYSREGRRPTSGKSETLARLVRAGLRVSLLLLLLGVLLPQLKFWFERQGWPDVVLLIDDSLSMGTADRYRDPQIQAAADRLARHDGLTEDERLSLAKALVTRSQPDWLTTLLTERRVRVHVYHCSGRAHRVCDVNSADDVAKGIEVVKGLQTEPANDSSQLGTAVRQVLNDFRGSTLAAVVMLTDGVTTEGENLPRVSKYAQQMGVPLFFVGIGDSHEVRDLYLHDLQVEDSVFVNDKVVFEVRLTAQGYDRLTVPVILRDKGKAKELARVQAQLDGSNKTVKVRLVHQPTEPGEKIYELIVPVQNDEVDKDNNRLERAVFVHETRQIKVLYIEGYRRYEYHYVKTLLERESARLKGNKSMDLKVLLLEADPNFPEQDRSAIAEFPTRSELNSFDVVVLGDVDPRPRLDGKLKAEHLKDLADFVRERGGGLLMIAGERHSPAAWKDSPLKDVLPIDIIGNGDSARGEDAIVEGYRPELTPVGRMHPIFRFSPDERENDEIWARLREMYWFADGYQVKRAAEVLAVHPNVRRANKEGVERTEKEGTLDRHPLVVQHFVGAGRAMFLGFDETWRWGFRENQRHFNQFWIQAVRYLARSRLGRVDLRLDRQTPYRRGEPIKVLVRFPDDAPPPAADTEVKVVAERRNPAHPGDTEVRTLNLAKVEGSRATYEALLTQTPEGEYKFWLSSPSVNPRPRAEAKVLMPPGEMDRLRMAQEDLERAAEESHGRFYTIADADKLMAELPVGTRVTVNAPGPPYLVWNHFALFLLGLLFLSTEWLLRKQKNLL